MRLLPYGKGRCAGARRPASIQEIRRLGTVGSRAQQDEEITFFVTEYWLVVIRC
jgi:hypothetical protein